MRILYDEEGDVLDVIFDEREHKQAQAGYELRRGVVIYVTRNFSPVQLTAVCFDRLTQVPVVSFDLLKKQPAKIRSKLLQLVSSPPLSSFLRIDAATFSGQVMNPRISEAYAKAA